MDVVIPGLDPWAEVIRNPYIWHFAMHAIPDLPELLVRGHEAEYFDYFFHAISADATKITSEARAAYAHAYATDGSLTAGFNWYRAFQQDATENRRTLGRRVTTPVLYVRGEHETGQIEAYVDGLRGAGVTNLEEGVVPGAGHFTQEEAPAATWELIADFIGL
jgi:pimeloyl-ACP methyl ester carboxylesterase